MPLLHPNQFSISLNGEEVDVKGLKVQESLYERDSIDLIFSISKDEYREMIRMMMKPRNIKIVTSKDQTTVYQWMEKMLLSRLKDDEVVGKMSPEEQERLIKIRDYLRGNPY
jgi:hypothetical protein